MATTTQSSAKDTSVKAGNRPAVIKRYYPPSLPPYKPTYFLTQPMTTFIYVFCHQGVLLPLSLPPPSLLTS